MVLTPGAGAALEGAPQALAAALAQPAWSGPPPAPGGAATEQRLACSPTPTQQRATAPRSATRRRAAPPPAPAVAADASICTEAVAICFENAYAAGDAMPTWPLLLPQHCALPGSAGRARRSTAGSKRYADYVLGGYDDGDEAATAQNEVSLPRVSCRGRPLSAPRRASDASDCRSAPRARKALRPAQQPPLLLALLAVAAAEEAGGDAGAPNEPNEPLLAAARAAAALAARCTALVNALGV